jgi:competence protein ComEC
MQKLSAALVVLFFTELLSAATKDLQLYFVDVEGGAATLIVTPAGESMLVDTGNPGNNDRDPKRIYAAAQDAGLTKIDYLLITHFDGDHVGGVPALAKMIPISRFLDHGDSIQAGTPPGARLWEGYLSASAGKRTNMEVGDRVPLKGLKVEAVSSNGQALAGPINGGKSNAALCRGAQQKDPDKTENALSLGFLLNFGKFTFLDLGDLTWDKEMELACPVNKLGKVTLYQATHHGFFSDRSGAPAHLFAIQPQVVIVNNGPAKGLTTPDLYKRITQIPGIEGIWQGHLTLANDAQHNTTADMIANLGSTAECKGYWLKVTVDPSGKYTVMNGRNGYSKTYMTR